MPGCRDVVSVMDGLAVAEVEGRYIRVGSRSSSVVYLESEFRAYHQREAAGTPQAVGTASEGKETKCRN